MSKIKIGFSTLDVPKQIERSRLIQTAMTGNASYATPVPSLATVKTATDNLEASYNESRGRDKNKVQIMKLRRAEMLALIIQLAAYVQSTSNGDKETILSSGFDVITRGVPQPPVGQVLNLRVSKGTVSGTVKLLWDRMPGARVYVIEVSTDPFGPETFEPRGVSTKSRFELDKLKPGNKYWMRVAAIGLNGLGDWSDPAAKIAE